MAIEELRRQAIPTSARQPHPRAVPAWTPAQEKALAEIINFDQAQRVWMGSLEITELIRRSSSREISSPVVAQFGPPTSPMGAVFQRFSPFGGKETRERILVQRQRGADHLRRDRTERQSHPRRTEIKLRPDGTFSFRFALPDGKYELPAVAVSADRTDGRAAELKFSRETQYLRRCGHASARSGARAAETRELVTP